MARMKGVGLRFRDAGLVLGVFLAASCGASDPAAGISSQPLSGKIGGRPWTAMTAGTLGPPTKIYGVYIFGTALPPCRMPDDMDEVILQVPDTVGSYDLDLTLAQSIIVGSIGQTLLTWKGKLVVESITATTVKGATKFEYDADNYVDGTFEATICPLM